MPNFFLFARSALAELLMNKCLKKSMLSFFRKEVSNLKFVLLSSLSLLAVKSHDLKYAF